MAKRCEKMALILNVFIYRFSFLCRDCVGIVSAFLLLFSPAWASLAALIGIFGE